MDKQDEFYLDLAKSGGGDQAQTFDIVTQLSDAIKGKVGGR